MITAFIEQRHQVSVVVDISFFFCVATPKDTDVVGNVDHAVKDAKELILPALVFLWFRGDTEWHTSVTIASIWSLESGEKRGIVIHYDSMEGFRHVNNRVHFSFGQ